MHFKMNVIMVLGFDALVAVCARTDEVLGKIGQDALEPHEHERAPAWTGGASIWGRMSRLWPSTISNNNSNIKLHTDSQTRL